MDKIAGPEAGRKQCARNSPVIRACTFGFVDRAGAGKHPADLAPTRCRETAEGGRRLLQIRKFGLARDRKSRQRSTRRDCGRIHIGQQRSEGRRMRHGMGNLLRKDREQRLFPRFGGTDFQFVVVVGHVNILAGGGAPVMAACARRVSLAKTSVCDCLINARACASVNASARLTCTQYARAR